MSATLFANIRTPQYNKYLDERKFRQFKIEDGNIVWGKNWDLIFPIEQLYHGHIE